MARDEIRRRYRASGDAERREVIEGLEASGLGLRAFSAETGIPVSTLRAWRRRPGVRGERRAEVAARSDFVELRVASPAAAPEVMCEVVLSDGTTLRIPRGFDVGELSRVLDLLAARC